MIRESKLRALLMKALECTCRVLVVAFSDILYVIAGFINRECASLDGAVVVFVGRRVRGNVCVSLAGITHNPTQS